MNKRLEDKAFMVFCMTLLCVIFFLYGRHGGLNYARQECAAEAEVDLVYHAARDRMVIEVGQDRDKKMMELKRFKQKRGCP